MTCEDRNTSILTAYQSSGYTPKEIGDHFGWHYSTVSGLIHMMAPVAALVLHLIWGAVPGVTYKRTTAKMQSIHWL